MIHRISSLVNRQRAIEARMRAMEGEGQNGDCQLDYLMLARSDQELKAEIDRLTRQALEQAQTLRRIARAIGATLKEELDR